jgi:hypothetical protein
MPTEPESYKKSFTSDGSGCDLFFFFLTWNELYVTGNGVSATG